MANESVAASSRFSGAHSFVTLAHLVMKNGASSENKKVAPVCVTTITEAKTCITGKNQVDINKVVAVRLRLAAKEG